MSINEDEIRLMSLEIEQLGEQPICIELPMEASENSYIKPRIGHHMQLLQKIKFYDQRKIEAKKNG